MSARGRLESLSDGAFAVAIGLLVVTIDAQKEFGQVVDVMRTAPAIAGAFAVILWIWAEHRRFFSRYELDDVPTVFLNGVLLFVVLLYVYPLKFVAMYVLGTLFGLFPADLRVALGSPRDGSVLLRIYGAGFIAIFALFFLLYRHAWRRRDALGLSPLARFDTRTSLRSSAICMGVGAFSVLFTLVETGWAAGVAGFSYVLLGPLMGFHGYRSGVERERLEAESAPT